MSEHKHQFERTIVRSRIPGFGIMVKQCACGVRQRLEKPNVHRPAELETRPR